MAWTGIMRDRAGRLTLVDGVFCRSLLEAKWLRFFTLLDIDYAYEPERFPDGISNIGYLPDVYLKKENLYIEIKPTYDIYLREKRKPEGFVRETGKRLLILVGEPGNAYRFLLHKMQDGSVASARLDHRALWSEKGLGYGEHGFLYEECIARRARALLKDRSFSESVLECYADIAVKCGKGIVGLNE